MSAWVLLALAHPLQDPVADSPSDGTAGPVIDGEIDVGVRLVERDGSQGQYDEDLNLEDGFFLRGARLRMRDLEGLPVESFELSARGVGDPFSSYRLEALGGPWRTLGRFDRSEYSGFAEADLHEFDLTRESGSLAFEYRPRNSATRSSLGLDYLHRDGLTVGSRSVGFEAVSGFPVHDEERALGVRGDLSTRAAGWALELALGLQNLEAEQRLSFSEPSELFPGASWTEEFDADSNAVQYRGELRLERELAESTSVDAGLEWESTDLTGTFDSFETGFFFDPNLPFERTTDADLELTESELSGDIGVVFPLRDATDAELRYTRVLEESDGDLPKITVLDELMGDPPTVAPIQDVSDHSSALDLFQLGLSTPVHARANLELGLEYGHESIDVLQIVDGIVVRTFDDSVDEFGGQGTVSVDAGGGVSIDVSGGYLQRPTETTEIGVEFTFDDDRISFGSLGCRWRGTRSTVCGEARLEHRHSEAFHSQGDLARGALSYAGQLGQTNLGANVSVQDYDFEARTTFIFFDPLIGIQNLPGLATFDGHEVALGGFVERPLFAGFGARLSWSAGLASGDAEFDFLTTRAALPCEIEPGLETGVEVLFQRFDGDGVLDPSDYDAAIVELYLRRDFGPPRTSQ